MSGWNKIFGKKNVREKNVGKKNVREKNHFKIHGLATKKCVNKSIVSFLLFCLASPIVFFFVAVKDREIPAKTILEVKVKAKVEANNEIIKFLRNNSWWDHYSEFVKKKQKRERSVEHNIMISVCIEGMCQSSTKCQRILKWFSLKCKNHVDQFLSKKNVCSKPYGRVDLPNRWKYVVALKTS